MVFRVTLVVGLAVAAVGCTSDHRHSGSGGRLGTVSGQILRVGGPSAAAYDTGGVVFAYRGDAYVGHVSVPPGQSFTLSLPAGTYRLTGGNRSNPHCARPVIVVVSAGHATQTHLQCDIR